MSESESGADEQPWFIGREYVPYELPPEPSPEEKKAHLDARTRVIAAELRGTGKELRAQGLIRDDDEPLRQRVRRFLRRFRPSERAAAQSALLARIAQYAGQLEVGEHLAYIEERAALGTGLYRLAETGKPREIRQIARDWLTDIHTTNLHREHNIERGIEHLRRLSEVIG